MRRQKRVLIVEDDRELLGDYSEIVSSAGYAVDATDTLTNAISKITDKTFHVAIIDIQLDKDNEHNQDGLTIIECLHDLNEGTEAIILSGQPKVEIAIEAYEKYDIAQYLEKGKKSPSDIVSAVQRAYARCKLNEYGTHATISAFLANQKDPTFWEDKCLSILQPSGGIKGLHSFLLELCIPYAPLIPKKNAQPPMRFDEGKHSVLGEFWSKAIGKPLLLEGHRKGAGIDQDNVLDSERLNRLDQPWERAGVVGGSFLIRANRDDFERSN